MGWYKNAPLLIRIDWAMARRIRAGINFIPESFKQILIIVLAANRRLFDE